MKELIPLVNKDIDVVMNYLNENHIINSFMIGNINKYNINNNEFKKRSGFYYGYYVDKILRGVLFFSNMGVFNCYYDDPSILDKIILLKTIKEHKPKYMFGPENLIKPLWDRLERTTKCFKYDNCIYMMMNKDNFNPFSLDKKIIEVEDYEFSKSVNFLIEVEKAFGRNPKTINELKNKIYDRWSDEKYFLLLSEGEIASQSIIQTTTSQISEIGGVYTTPRYRYKGFAKGIVSKTCNHILNLDKKPTLIVSKNNSQAIQIYRQLGFKQYYDYLTIEFKII